MVVRFVVRAVDKVCADVAQLHKHVVECGGHGAYADVVGVFGCPLRIVNFVLRKIGEGKGERDVRQRG